MFSSFRKVCTIIVLSFAATANADVEVSESNNAVIIENEAVKFVYDLSRGSYDAIDKRNNSVCIEDGYFQIDDLTTLTPGFEAGFR